MQVETGSWGSRCLLRLAPPLVVRSGDICPDFVQDSYAALTSRSPERIGPPVGHRGHRARAWVKRVSSEGDRDR